MGLGEVEFIKQHPGSGPQGLRNHPLGEAPGALLEPLTGGDEGALGPRQRPLRSERFVEEGSGLLAQPRTEGGQRGEIPILPATGGHVTTDKFSSVGLAIEVQTQDRLAQKVCQPEHRGGLRSRRGALEGRRHPLDNA